MKSLKKIIRKLYHLIWFLSVFLIISPHVNAETITYSFNRFTTSASTYSPQCNDTLCVYYNYPVSFNQVFTSRWDSSSSKTCNTSAVLSGRFSMEGSGEFILNRDWLENHLKEVYISTNGTTYICNNSITGGSGNPIINFSCSVPKLTANPSFGYRFNTSSNSNITANATSIIYRNINVSCDTSATDIIDNNNFNTDRVIRDADRNSELEREKIQDNTDAINGVDDTLKDDTAPTIDLSDLEVSSDTPISDLITMPLTILNTLIQTLDGSCTNYTIPFFYNSSITFPCFTISDYLGSNLTNYIDLFICFYMCYNIAMLVISVFDDITSLQDIYNSLYVPKHAASGYQPKHARGGSD